MIQLLGSVYFLYAMLAIMITSLAVLIFIMYRWGLEDRSEVEYIFFGDDPAVEDNAPYDWKVSGL